MILILSFNKFPRLPFAKIVLFINDDSLFNALMVNYGGEAKLITQVINGSIGCSIHRGENIEVIIHGGKHLLANRGFAYRRQGFKDSPVFPQGPVNRLNALFFPTFYLVVECIAAVGITEFFVDTAM